MSKFKKPFLFVLFLLPIAIVAGIFVGIYQLDIYPAEILAEIVTELGSTDILILISALQTIFYALFCGFFGYILADKIGLLRPFRPIKKNIIITVAVSVIGGILFSMDYWVFGHSIDTIQSSVTDSLNFSSTLATVLYGGIIEEVMLRLFFMSLITFILWKLFGKKYDRENIPIVIFVSANILAALLFASSHLPTTFVLFGGLTPLLLVRCFLLNGGFGLVFGRLYRKYGIIYAMLSHMLFHIVARLIWFIFT